MDSYNRNKFWIAIGRQGAYSEEDNFIFRVWPKSENKNHHWDLMPKFIEAEDLEDARRKLHWFIDKMFGDFYIPTDKERGLYTPPAPIVSPSLEGIDSLTIGAEPTVEIRPKNDGLLDLGKLV